MIASRSAGCKKTQPGQRSQCKNLRNTACCRTGPDTPLSRTMALQVKQSVVSIKLDIFKDVQ